MLEFKIDFPQNDTLTYEDIRNLIDDDLDYQDFNLEILKKDEAE